MTRHAMSSHRLISLACFLGAAVLGVPTLAQSTTVSDPQLTLTHPAEIELAESLSKAIDAVSSRVKECLTTEAAPAQLCFCRYPKEVTKLRTQYEAVLVRFPTWQGKNLNWSIPGKKESRTISMAGLKSQLKQECPK